MNSVIDDTDRAGLDQVAARSLEKCMGARPGEQIGIVFDEKRRDIAEAFFRAGNFLGCETVAVEMATGCHSSRNSSADSTRLMPK